MQQPPTFPTNRRVGCVMWLAIVSIILSSIGIVLDITQELAWNLRVEQALSASQPAQVAAVPLVSEPSQPLPSPSDAPAAIPQVTGPTYEAVCDADTNNMTDPQIAAFAQQWIGQRFSGWHGWVYDVESRAGGTYNLEIAMEERGLFWGRDIVIENINSDLAGRLNVEQLITFSGRIARNDVFLEGVCNPLVVEDYVVND